MKVQENCTKIMSDGLVAFGAAITDKITKSEEKICTRIENAKDALGSKVDAIAELLHAQQQQQRETEARAALQQARMQARQQVQHAVMQQQQQQQQIQKQQQTRKTKNKKTKAPRRTRGSRRQRIRGPRTRSRARLQRNEHGSEDEEEDEEEDNHTEEDASEDEEEEEEEERYSDDEPMGRRRRSRRNRNSGKKKQPRKKAKATSGRKPIGSRDVATAKPHGIPHDIKRDDTLLATVAVLLRLLLQQGHDQPGFFNDLVPYFVLTAPDAAASSSSSSSSSASSSRKKSSNREFVVFSTKFLKYYLIWSEIFVQTRKEIEHPYQTATKQLAYVYGALQYIFDDFGKFTPLTPAETTIMFAYVKDAAGYFVGPREEDGAASYTNKWACWCSENHVRDNNIPDFIKIPREAFVAGVEHRMRTPLPRQSEALIRRPVPRNTVDFPPARFVGLKTQQQNAIYDGTSKKLHAGPVPAKVLHLLADIREKQRRILLESQQQQHEIPLLSLPEAEFSTNNNNSNATLDFGEEITFDDQNNNHNVAIDSGFLSMFQQQ